MALFSLLAGCDYFAQKELVPGKSTGFEVREKMGAPSMEWKNADGSLTWEFARTPAGKQNYMVTVGPDNVMTKFEQVLTEANLQKVRTGMTEDEVRRLLGKPAEVAKLPLKPVTVWTWGIEDVFPRETKFDVHFDEAGKVIGIDRRDDRRG